MSGIERPSCGYLYWETNNLGKKKKNWNSKEQVEQDGATR